MKFSEPPKPPGIGPETNKKRSQRQEKRIAASSGGSVQPGSGAFPGYKGDVRAFIGEDEVLVECKTTKAKSHAVSIEKLKKITIEASQYDLLPAYAISFENMPHPFDIDWVLVPKRALGWDDE